MSKAPISWRVVRPVSRRVEPLTSGLGAIGITALVVLYLTGALLAPYLEWNDFIALSVRLSTFGAAVGDDSLSLQAILVSVLVALLIARLFGSSSRSRGVDQRAAAAFGYVIAGFASASAFLTLIGSAATAEEGLGRAWSSVVAGFVVVILAAWTGVRTFGTRKQLRRRAREGAKTSRALLRRYRARGVPRQVPLIRVVRLLLIFWALANLVAVAVIMTSVPATPGLRSGLVLVASVISLAPLAVALITAYIRASLTLTTFDHVVRQATAWALIIGAAWLSVRVSTTFVSEAGFTGKAVLLIASTLPLVPAALPAVNRWWSLVGLCAARCHRTQRRQRLAYLQDLWVLGAKRHWVDPVGWPRRG